MDNTKDSIANFVLALLILAFIVGCGCPNSAQQDPASRRGSDPQPSNISVEIRQLALDFKENEVRADQLYQNKRITATGTVATVGAYGSKTVLYFERGMLNPETLCFFTNTNDLAQLRSNQAVTVEATVLGFNADKIAVLLDDCTLK